MMIPLGAIILSLFLVTTAHAISIEARLIRGTNAQGVTDERLKQLAPKLKKVFGYANYQQLGLQQENLKPQERLALNLGEGFALFVLPKPSQSKLHELELELTSGKAPVVKTAVKVPANRAIFIKGPEVGSSLIIVAITVVE